MNNRQNGRRRGRNNNNNSNNSRQQSGGRGGMDQANRIDSRARGNGAQMIEKFRNMARDAQLAGDRVQTEYYLQFADHYFRVVSDFRQRQEESRPQGSQDRPNDRQRELRGVEDFDGHDDGDNDGDQGDSDNDGNDSRDNRDARNDRGDRDRGDRNDRPNNRNRQNDDDSRGNRQPPRGNPSRGRDEDNDADADSQDERSEEAAPAPRTNRRPARRPREAAAVDDSGTGIDSAALPPAIGRNGKASDAADADEDAPAPKPRRTRRTLAARSEGAEAAE